jgi:predicted secreted protein
MSHNIQVNAKSFEELEAVMAQIREKFGVFRFTSIDMTLSLTSNVGMMRSMEVAQSVVAARAVVAAVVAAPLAVAPPLPVAVAVDTVQNAMDTIVPSRDSVSLSNFEYQDVVRVSEAERRARLQRAIGAKGRQAVQAKLKYLVNVTGTPAQVLKTVEKERHRIYEADLRWTVASA